MTLPTIEELNARFYAACVRHQIVPPIGPVMPAPVEHKEAA